MFHASRMELLEEFCFERWSRWKELKRCSSCAESTGALMCESSRPGQGGWRPHSASRASGTTEKTSRVRDQISTSRTTALHRRASSSRRELGLQKRRRCRCDTLWREIGLYREKVLVNSG